MAIPGTIGATVKFGRERDISSFAGHRDIDLEKPEETGSPGKLSGRLGRIRRQQARSIIRYVLSATCLYINAVRGTFDVRPA